MTDTIKRLAGPSQPEQTTAGTLLYTAGGSTVTAVKSALLHNTDPLMGAFFTMAIGSSLTDLSKRVLSSHYVAPGDTEYVPLDLVLGNSETLYARQSCMVDPIEMSIGAATPALNAGSGTTIVSASYTLATNDLLLLTVILSDPGATAVVSGFTDTHTGVTWTLLQSYVSISLTNAPPSQRIYQYTAQSSGDSTTTTTVTFDTTCDVSALCIDKIIALGSVMEDSSGTNGSTGFRALGTGEAPGATTAVFVAAEVGASVLHAHGSGTAADTQTTMTGWNEIDDFGTTNALTISSAYVIGPAAWTRPTLALGTRTRVSAFAEILNKKRSIVVILNGVEGT